jgi:cullin-4
MNKTWQDHGRHMIMIRSIFLYLDRTFVLQSSGISTLWDMGLNLFHQIILNISEIRSRITEGILLKIEKERKGEIIDRILLKSLIRMFTEMQIYQDTFEATFINVTSQFYKAEALEYIQTYDVRENADRKFL